MRSIYGLYLPGRIRLSGVASQGNSLFPHKFALTMTPTSEGCNVYSWGYTPDHYTPGTNTKVKNLSLVLSDRPSVGHCLVQCTFHHYGFHVKPLRLPGFKYQINIFYTGQLSRFTCEKMHFTKLCLFFYHNICSAIFTLNLDQLMY